MWFLAGQCLGIGACFHDAGSGSNPKTSVCRNAVQPTCRLRRAFPNLEWAVKVSQHDSPPLWDRVSGTFDTYWQDGEIPPYNASARDRLKIALESQRGGNDEPGADTFFFDLRPHEFQR